MSKLLVIDTSSAKGSWALFTNGQCVHRDSFDGRASGSLAPSLLALGGELQGIEKLVVGVGPGSFSGIRVGIASAQGLAAVLNCPIMPARSTHALAWKFRHETDLGIFADARRQQFFHTAYANGQLATPTHLITGDELGRLVKQHRLAISVEPIPQISQVEYPDAEDLGHAYLNFPAEKELALEPIYLHGAVK
ncbi:MAG: tRNA (adenosine(37)-N6)-threonylcarbamoyltransferase complex dimerization subunit type 1 TsaB [Verrucomicrobiales bacterium]|jgi:tRNA threonylcarbamoyladenosine biosynthesis protein TsaB|nr:tRNA (adenosine(37)-N6)-threonylcarbamoyltransferase complex dimerization subunit type 1 TsaB [Verrucomicrobiales bacterium]